MGSRTSSLRVTGELARRQHSPAHLSPTGPQTGGGVQLSVSKQASGSFWWVLQFDLMIQCCDINTHESRKISIHPLSVRRRRRGRREGGMRLTSWEHALERDQPEAPQPKETSCGCSLTASSRRFLPVFTLPPFQSPPPSDL